MRENQNDESYRTSKDTQIASAGCPSEPAKTLMDLQVKAYENRLRERLIAKYSTRTPAEAKHHVSGTYYSAKERRLLINWPLGTIVVTGPKTLEFYEQFSNHRATLIRADGKDILLVKMHLNSEGMAEKDAEVVTREIGSEDLWH